MARTAGPSYGSMPPKRERQQLFRHRADEAIGTREQCALQPRCAVKGIPVRSPPAASIGAPSSPFVRHVRSHRSSPSTSRWDPSTCDRTSTPDCHDAAPYALASSARDPRSWLPSGRHARRRRGWRCAHEFSSTHFPRSTGEVLLATTWRAECCRVPGDRRAHCRRAASHAGTACRTPRKCRSASPAARRRRCSSPGVNPARSGSRG